MPLAYSYVRFSSTKQARGDSMRRQDKAAREYAAAHDLTLDESLSLRDLGVSAYDGSNVRRGALGGFLDALRDGRVKAGSFLLVEQLDRLSRDNVFAAIGILQEIVNAGITLVTLQDKRVFDRETVKQLDTILMSVLIMARAHEESETKSMRLTELWTAKRLAKPPVFTSMCPQWLTVRADRSGYDIIPGRAESVRKIFELTAGGYGNVSIARRANSEGWPVPGKADSWHPTLITKVLGNRAVLGEFHPHGKLEGQKKRVPLEDAWPDYFPAVVEESLFLRAQSSKATRAQLPRRRDDRYLNVFQGVLKCVCGSSFVRKYKGSKTQPTYVQYQCSARIRGLTECQSLSAIKLIAPLLRVVYEAGFVSLSNDDMSDWIRVEVESAREGLSQEKAKMANVMQALEIAPDLEPFIQRVRQLRQSVQEKEKHLTEREGWMLQMSAAIGDNEVEGQYSEAIEKLTGDEHIDFRAALHERITRIVESVAVDSKQRKAIIKWRTLQADNTVMLAN